MSSKCARNIIQVFAKINANKLKYHRECFSFNKLNLLKFSIYPVKLHFVQVLNASVLIHTVNHRRGSF